MNRTKNLRAVFDSLALLVLFLAVTPPARAVTVWEPSKKFTWVVTEWNLGGGPYDCDGVLIAPSWVLTAAHCIGSLPSGGTVNYSMDAFDWIYEGKAPAKFIKHPNYVEGHPEHDIALVRLSEAIHRNWHLQPAELPIMPAAANQTGTVVSPTHINTAAFSVAVLRGAVTLSGGYSFQAKSPNASLCERDIGGGFMTLNQGLNVVTGIVSQVSLPAFCDVPGQPFVAVDVFQHLGWILSTTSANGPALPPPNTIPAQVVNADYDGDGKVDLAVKTALGDWKIDFASNGFGFWDVIYSGYGFEDAHAVPADYDGDGKADLSVKTDGGDWYIDYAANGFGRWDVVYHGYGGANAHPVPADYDGDGKADLSVKTDGGVWYIDYAKDGFGAWNASYGGYGWADAYPVPADYDGDRKADLSIKSGAWYIDYAGNGFGAWNAVYSGWGDSTFPPVPGDYDGDHRADLAVYNGLNNSYHIDFATDGFGVVNLTVLEAP